jgi:hypothetical protein
MKFSICGLSSLCFLENTFSIATNQSQLRPKIIKFSYKARK